MALTSNLSKLLIASILILAIGGGTYALGQGPLPGFPDVSSTPVGAVTPYAGSSAPPGWLIADGSVVSRTTYPELFAAIGTTYGAGDGSTTFNLPDLRGRTVAGVGTNADVDSLNDNEGAALGLRRPAHTHTVNSHTHSVPSHTHTIPAHTHTVAGHSHGLGTISASGGDHAHTIFNFTDTGSGWGNQWGYGDPSFRGDQGPWVATGTTAGATHTHATSDFSGRVGNTAGSNGDSAITTSSTALTTDAASLTTGASSPDTDAQGPAYITLNYIIHVKPAP
jgi:microcystin-dependent protein